MVPRCDPADERSRTHGALASTSRIHILNLLRDSAGPLDVAQIAAHSGLHPNTVRFHLRILVGAGLAGGRADPQGSAGRPRLVYTAATDTPGPDGSALLADILAGYLAASSACASGLAEQAGHAFGRRHQQPAAGLSVEQAVRHLIAMFAELGFESESVPDGQDVQIRLRACPFQALATKYPDVVCSLHLGLIRGTLVRLGAPVTARTLRPFVEPHLCIAHLTPTTEPGAKMHKHP